MIQGWQNWYLDQNGIKFKISSRKISVKSLNICKLNNALLIQGSKKNQREIRKDFDWIKIQSIKTYGI